MVPSSALIVAADGECLSCGGFHIGETILFWSLEFIIDDFSGLRFSPRRDGSNANAMGSTPSGPPSPLRAMIGHSTEEFHMVSNEEGGINLPSPKRPDTSASPTPASTISWSENTLTPQAMAMIPPW
jgi:hypothetical protein